MEWFCKLNNQDLKKTRYIFLLIIFLSYMIGIVGYVILFWIYLELCRKDNCNKKRVLISMLLLIIAVIIGILYYFKHDAIVRDPSLAGAYYCTVPLKDFALSKSGDVSWKMGNTRRNGNWTSKDNAISINLNYNGAGWRLEKMPYKKAQGLGKEPSHSFYRYEGATYIDTCHRNGFIRKKSSNKYNARDLMLGNFTSEGFTPDEDSIKSKNLEDEILKQYK